MPVDLVAPPLQSDAHLQGPVGVLRHGRKLRQLPRGDWVGRVQNL